MTYGICSLSMVPVRLEPADSSEMVSQLLFGEMFKVLIKRTKWLKIRCQADGYEGWISAKQAQRIKRNEFLSDASKRSYCLDIVQGAMSDNHYIPITLGSTLPNYDGLNFKIAKQKFTYSGQVIAPSQVVVDRDLLIKVARKYLYAPYLWGGRSPYGIDCSGFVQVVFKLLGISLPRDAYQQAEVGEEIELVDAAVGDLAFFDNKKKRIIHVGIILEKGKIIHASGRVRIDKIDRKGIYNKEVKKYSHRLRVVKRTALPLLKDVV